MMTLSITGSIFSKELVVGAEGHGSNSIGFF